MRPKYEWEPFHCTIGNEVCAVVGESVSLYGIPQTPNDVCYVCRNHGFYVMDVFSNALHRNVEWPNWDFAHVRDNMNIEWEWLQEEPDDWPEGVEDQKVT